MMFVSRVIGKVKGLVERTTDFLCTSTSYQTTLAQACRQYVKYVVGQGADTTETNGRIYASSSSGFAEAYFYFDFSSVPEDAQDISVVFKIKQTSNDNSQYAEAAINDTGTGKKTSLTGTGVVSINIPSITQSNLLNLGITVYVNNSGACIHGMTATVTYKVRE